MCAHHRRIAAVVLGIIVAVGAAGAAGCSVLSSLGSGTRPEGELSTASNDLAGTTGSGPDQSAGGASSVPLPQPYDYPPSDGIVKNASFERGLDGWEVWDQPGSKDPGNNGIEASDWAERGGKVLHVTRTSKRDGGAAGIIQKLDYDCSSAKSLWVTYQAYVNFEQGGNIAGKTPAWFPESGAQARLKYLDASGAEHEWYGGVYITPTTGADTVRFLQISNNRWVHMVSDDLMRLDPKPARLTEVRFYGFGWGFDAMMDDCQIVTGG
jgi:hypothetical protein